MGFILQAMAADFYPRLTSSAGDNTACNRLVNEQTLVGLLLAGPGVLATLTFAPLVISLFYTAKFGAAVGILRWICSCDIATGIASLGPTPRGRCDRQIRRGQALCRPANDHRQRRS